MKIFIHKWSRQGIIVFDTSVKTLVLTQLEYDSTFDTAYAGKMNVSTVFGARNQVLEIYFVELLILRKKLDLSFALRANPSRASTRSPDIIVACDK